MPAGNQLVVLKLEGDLEQGFQITLELGAEGERPRLELQGHLPSAPELVTALEQWQQSYRQLGSANRIVPKEIIYGGSVNRVEHCRQVADQLRERFTRWLQADGFRLLDQRLREELSRDDPIRILIRTLDSRARRLPWYSWDFVERYPQSEVVLSGLTAEALRRSPPATKTKVRILAILGHSAGIQVEADRQLLEQLPDAEVTFLIEPRRPHITDQLWDQPWDILFFAGHSQTEGQQGRIYINPHESLTLDELKYGLKRSIAQGLQLAIFNSCDGLGLAQALEQLHLPQMIIMREPVPDLIAQTFLRYFLNAFANGELLYLAERQARERLQGLEQDYPCASWLPMICQNAAEPPLSWQSFRGGAAPLARSPAAPVVPTSVVPTSVVPTSVVPTSVVSTQLTTIPANPLLNGKLAAAAIISSLATAAIIGLRSLGLLQSVELASFDTMLRLRPVEPPDRRILVVTVDERDIQYQDQQGMERRGSLSDQALSQLLDRVAPLQPSGVGLDIFHDFAFAPRLETQFKTMPLVGICTADSPSSTGAPPGLPEQQIGFSDLPVDANLTIRRQLVGMDTVPECPTDRAFSLQMALKYLAQHKADTLSWTATNQVQLGGVTLPKLPYNAAGYQLPFEQATGYQILLNYRASHPPQIALREVLSGTADLASLNLATHPIVLIGVADNKDAFFTPYHQGELFDRLPGIVVHAQMISQLISTVLDDRPLLWWWPKWGEALWMGSWSLVSGGLLLWITTRSTKSGRHLQAGLVISLVWISLYGSCFAILLQGGWVPFIPTAMAIGITGVGICIYAHHSVRKPGFL